MTNTVVQVASLTRELIVAVLSKNLVSHAIQIIILFRILTSVISRKDQGGPTGLTSQNSRVHGFFVKQKWWILPTIEQIESRKGPQIS